MKEETLFKIRKVLIRVGVGLLSLLLAYLVVYKFSYLPEGYKVISKGKSEAVLSTYSLWGKEDQSIHYVPKEKDSEWEVHYLSELVHQLKDVYLLFFSMFFLFIFFLLYEIKRAKPLILIIWAKGTSISVLVAVIPIARLLAKIHDLL
ncbi:hypothetical protein Q7A53_16535 [Halobacillus rhizosphaerae]|uniref:hypothetical protein n=1 Tax=Halobacillus rhizosphaerae TaxID=3064889 RepID=UPI00398B2A70